MYGTPLLYRLPLIAALSVALLGCAQSACSDTAGDAIDGLDPEEVYGDLYDTLGTVRRVPVRGRIIEDEDAAGLDPFDIEPLDVLTQIEVEDTELAVALVDPQSGQTVLELGTVRTDDEGYLDVVVDTGATPPPPGTWRLEARYEGRVVGSATTRLLAEDYTGFVARSDVDLTWLDTDIHSTSAILELVLQDASERETLPAMPLVYAALRDAPGADVPLVFLSGSPAFFKRTLEARAELDGVAIDGLVLKPFDEIVATNLAELDPEEIVPELREQVGYKLFWLLRLREHVPPGAREILLGDDSEADFVVYALYHRYLSGELELAGLLAELDALGVAQSWRAVIEALAPQVRARVTAPEPVAQIYIHLTGTPSETLSLDDWRIPGIVRPHEGAWPLVLDLYEEGLATAPQVEAVRTRLRELGRTDEALDAAAQRALADGVLDEDTLEVF